MKSYEKVFVDFLKRNNLKLTHPRSIILQAVFRNHDHFDIETLYDQIRVEHKNVSRATIYRTIPLLVEAGLIKNPLRQESKDRYEYIYGHRDHLHLVCSKCSKIIEAGSKQIEKLLAEIAQKHDFRIEEYNLVVSGICKKCLNK
ncbi:MAG: hypothetical protein APR54_01665 [Candidatus Cloacimonas sp. SDB]|nr:MAG: hypothetical protein APR54_01665 [Candidatus Cloacimonas sp. SDB]